MSDHLESVCRVCGSQSQFAFSQQVLGRNVAYFDCRHCGYVQTQTPTWLGEAYADPIDEMDTGIMSRNNLNVARVVLTLAALHQMRGRVLDHAGGHGILVRLLRDAGVEAHWDDKYCRNLLARGFEADAKPYDLVTAFEVLEHLEHPVSELEAMLKKAPRALLSTDLIMSEEIPAPDWWYFGPEHGQHVGFFRARTLEFIAERLGCHVQTDGRSLHLFSKKAIPWTWRALQRVPQAASTVARLRLRSKVWSDFEAIRRKRNGA